MSGSSVSIKNFTRRPVAPRGAFAAIAKAILPAWNISLAFVGPTKARALNEQLRGKSYTPNVLSYALGNKSGEIIICPSETAKQAADYNLQPATCNLYLFIHGLLHLKGWAHGVTMERCERKLLKQFCNGALRSSLHVTTHNNRNRHRHVPSKDGSRRRARR